MLCIDTDGMEVPFKTKPARKNATRNDDDGNRGLKHFIRFNEKKKMKLVFMSQAICMQ